MKQTMQSQGGLYKFKETPSFYNTNTLFKKMKSREK